MTRGHDQWWRADDGNAPLELVILAPIIMFLIGLVIAAGRITVAQGSVDAAARDAAREASIAVSATVARDAALSSARAALRGDGLQCQPAIALNLGGFSVPPGQPAHVSATVTCTERLSDLLVPGMPGYRTMRATFTSPIDPFRSRAIGRGSLSRSAGAWPAGAGWQGAWSADLAPGAWRPE